MKNDERRPLYYAVFNTQNGKKVLKDIGALCDIGHSSFNSDPLKMAYNEGQKELYRRILRIIEAN